MIENQKQRLADFLKDRGWQIYDIKISARKESFKIKKPFNMVSFFNDVESFIRHIDNCSSLSRKMVSHIKYIVAADTVSKPKKHWVFFLEDSYGGPDIQDVIYERMT